MTVWVLVLEDEESTWVAGVYSSVELAQQAYDRIERTGRTTEWCASKYSDQVGNDPAYYYTVMTWPDNPGEIRPFVVDA